MLWFETSTCCSSSFKRGSSNISHQLPRMRSSRGCAIFQPSVLGKSAGVSSRKAAGVETPGGTAEGRAYSGARLQPARRATTTATDILREVLMAPASGTRRLRADDATARAEDGGGRAT